MVTFILMLVFQLTSGNTSASGTNSLKWNNSVLNTASNVSYLSPIEKEVILEINKLRSNPAKYANDYIIPLAKNYSRKILHYPGDNPIRTNEGVSALNECVQVLKRQTPLPLVYPGKGLTKAAADHVKDQSRSGKTGHNGNDGSDVKERIERYGSWNVRIAENIAYGGFSAQQIVIYLLIDDGVSNRGHRKTFLHPDYKIIGVATGSHPGYKNMCVMDFAGSFTDF